MTNTKQSLQVHVRMSPELKALGEQAARATGRSFSHFIKDAMILAAALGAPQAGAEYPRSAHAE